MKNFIKQILFGILIALISLGIVIGSYLLSISEGY